MTSTSRTNRAGEARTWANELTREGVQGLEHGSMREWSRHNATLPFTRYLAGAGDYTPVVFGERRKETSSTAPIRRACWTIQPSRSSRACRASGTRRSW